MYLLLPMVLELILVIVDDKLWLLTGMLPGLDIVPGLEAGWETKLGLCIGLDIDDWETDELTFEIEALSWALFVELSFLAII